MAVVLVDLRLGLSDPRIGGAHAGTVTHRDHEEGPPVVGEEGQDVVGGGNLRDDEMDSLREDHMVAGRDAARRIEGIGPRPAGIDHGATSDRGGVAGREVRHLRVVQPVAKLPGTGAQVVHRASARVPGALDEVEDEARVRVRKERVGVGHPAAHLIETEGRLGGAKGAQAEAARAGREALPDEPVGERPEVDREGAVRGALVEGREEADLAHRRRIRRHEAVARLAEAAHEAELRGLEILDAAPDQAGGGGTRLPREVPGLREGHLEASCREGRGRDRPVDATADHEDVEDLGGQPRQLFGAGRWVRRGRAVHGSTTG